MRALLFLSILFAPQLQTSTVVVSGLVLTGVPALPVPGAIVRAGTTSATTDAAGRFELTMAVATAARSVRLTTVAPGFLDQEVDVAISAGKGAIEILLRANPQYREDITVSGRREQALAAPPALPLEAAEVLSVAGAGDNVFRVLQTLPGVAATDDFGSRLSVRGGGPDQNLTVMDGVEIHNPYRLFGLTSAFNPETVDSFELTAGGFSPKYGDRLSSILVIDNRAGTRTAALAGSAALSVTDANVVVEGRLPRGSWLVTGRRTYYDLFAERVTNNDLPSFGDLQSKVVFTPRPGQQLTAFGLRSREKTDSEFEGDIPGDRLGLNNTSSNDVVSLTLAAPIGGRATSRTVAAYYRYGDALDVDGSLQNETTRANAPGDDAFTRASIVFTRSLLVRDLSLRQELNVAAGARHTIGAGAELHALHTSWGWRITGDRNESEANGSSVLGGAGLPDLLDSSANNARIGAWLEDDVQLAPGVRAAGGVRLEWNGLTGETVALPRTRATIELSPRTRLRLAAGRYSQSPGYEKLLQADYFVDLSNADALALKNERAVHWIGGIERDLGGSMTGRVEGYYKTFDRLIVGRLESPAEQAERVAQYAFPVSLASSVPTAAQITTEPGNGAGGEAYGIEAYVAKRPSSTGDMISGWASYSWGHASIDAYGRDYPFDYDRRHSLSIVSTWRLSPRFRLGATVRAASGFPDTQPIGLRVASVLAPGAVDGAAGSLVPRRDVNGLYVWTTDTGGVSNLNAARLPLYARVDLRLTYARSAASRWQVYLEVINALNRDNAGSLSAELDYDASSDRPRLTLTPDGGLPRLPSFGLRWRF